MLLDGEHVSFDGPGDAVAAGIGMVHQHFMLIPVFTVTESVALGYEPTSGVGMLDFAAARRRVEEISARFGFDVDPDATVEELPVGVQQRVEIIKALARDAKVLILDEPTAVLTPQETDELISIMRQLKEAKHLHPLHHAQAARGEGSGGHHHRHPQGRSGRLRAAQRVRDGARLHDGRTRGQPDHAEGARTAR